VGTYDHNKKAGIPTTTGIPASTPADYTGNFGLGAIAASLASGPAAAASDLVRPLQHQAELLQQVLQRQLEFERELVGRAAAPLHAAQDLVDQATGTFRAQATSFRAASTTFGQLAGLMDQQADLLERAGTLMHDPLTAFRSPGDEAIAEND